MNQMEGNNKNQELTKKSGVKLITPTQQKTLDLSKDIISKKTNVAMFEMNLTMEKAINSPTIRSVFKGESAQIGFSVVNVLVTRFIESFGFSKTLDTAQIEMITVDTLENFAYESLEDIILFFKMARSGKFGTTKRGVDSNLIFGEWFPMYLEKKSQLRERKYSEQKGNHNSKGVTMEDVRKTYQKNHDKNFEKRVRIYIDKITKLMDRQLLEDTIIDWENDPVKKPYVRILKEKRKTIK